MAERIPKTPASKKAGAKATSPRAAGTKKAGGRKSAAKKVSAKRVSAATASTRRTADPIEAEVIRERAADAADSRFFRRATARARRVVNDPEKLRDIADRASRSSALRSMPFASAVDDVRALIRLVVAYARGMYRRISVDKLVLIVAGLIYVVAPLDALPDALPAVGFLDDATVIAWIIKSVRDELDAFRDWEEGIID